VHSCGKAQSLSREEGGKQNHRVAGSRKGEQMSRWVKYLILQVVQWFVEEKNFEVTSRQGYLFKSFVTFQRLLGRMGNLQLLNGISCGCLISSCDLWSSQN
jgi:hypothetical protein